MRAGNPQILKKIQIRKQIKRVLILLIMYEVRPHTGFFQSRTYGQNHTIDTIIDSEADAMDIKLR